ncbi:MAG TPA: Thivi_2564 family membrane protein [Nitrobacter sp.]|nr:Thivi_2564 family membrane protein [Nitrobacter sp.]
MLINILITFFVVVLVLYFINLVPLERRGKQIVRVAVIVIGVASALRFLPVL